MRKKAGYPALNEKQRETENTATGQMNHVTKNNSPVAAVKESDTEVKKEEGKEEGSSFLKEKIEGYAMNIPGYLLLCTILGKSPITGKRVSRTARAIISAFLSVIPGGTFILKQLEEAGTITSVLKWLKVRIGEASISGKAIIGQLSSLWEKVSFWTVFKYSGKFIDVLVAPARKLIGIAKSFGSKVAELSFKGVLKMIGAPVEKIMSVLSLAGQATEKIFRDPVGFFKNLGTAMKGGFGAFTGNIKQFLRKGLMFWLFGTLAKSGFALPEKFNLSGIFSIVVQLLNITYTSIRTQMVKRLGKKGEQIMAFLEKSFDVVRNLATKGPAALWEKAKGSLGNVKELLFSGLVPWLRNTIIASAVKKIFIMLNPAGAIVGAVTSIYNLVMFLIESSQQMAAVTGSVFKSLGEIVAGRVGKASKLITSALAGSVPLLLSFFSRFIGLKGLSGKIREVVGKMRKPVDKAVKSAIGWVAEKGKRLWNKAGSFSGKSAKKVKNWWQIRKRFRLANGEEHTLFYKGRGKNAVLMMASTPIKLKKFLIKNKKKLVKADNTLYKEAWELVTDHDLRRSSKKISSDDISGMMDKLRGIIYSLSLKSAKFSGEPFAFGHGTRSERALNLVTETAALTNTKVYRYVDDITYSQGSSWFDLIEGKRVLNIGSNTFNKSRAGQMTDVLHEVTHAKKWKHTLDYKYKGNFNMAYEDFFMSKPFGSNGYAFDEVIAEKLSIKKLKRTTELTPQQIGASTKYIKGWRKFIK
ncbi:MAG: hypothetical protein GY714_32030 [Desulfobacterales bacterium]|nr:hypothetical protein [Desulfobacterales bacterium]